jgi:predicted nuclease of predicted toxin-antitoxin system
MRFKIDENLPQDLVGALRALGHDAESVFDEGLSGVADPEVWDAAQREQRFLITQDVRFADARMFTPGAHHGMMLVRLKRPGLRALLEKIAAVIAEEDVQSWPGCFVVLTDGKLRVRRKRSES